MYFVAHYDDDLYFMNPDIQTSITAGNNVVVVYVSGAGAATPVDEQYWTNRERGILDAYDHMASPGSTWSATLTSFDDGDSGSGSSCSGSGCGKQVAVLTHPLASPYASRNVTLIFMRLADTQLETLWSGTNDDNSPHPGFAATRQACSHCVLGTLMPTTDTYSRAQLIATLAAIMKQYGAQSISTLDVTGLNYAAFTNPHDISATENGSHVAAALFTLAAAQQYQAASTTTQSVFLRTYRGYSNGLEPENLSPDETTTKCETSSYYEAWDCTVTLDKDAGTWVPCWNSTDTPTRPTEAQCAEPGDRCWCSGPHAFFSDTRMYSTRSVLGTGQLQGRLAVNTSTSLPQCLGVDGTGSYAITTSCSSAPQWIITKLNEIQLVGTTNCLEANPTGRNVLIAPCSGAAGMTPARDYMTFFLLSNGQLRSRELGDTGALPSPFPPNPSGSCVSANGLGSPVTYDYCGKNCINSTTGATDPTCTSDNRPCAGPGSAGPGDSEQVDPPGCAGAGAGGDSSQICSDGLIGGGNWNCFALPAGTPSPSQDWTMVFDPLHLVSTDFSDSSGIGTANSYYRTFGIGDKNVCVRNAAGVSCASANLARNASVGASSSYEVSPWGAANVVDGSVVSTGSSYGFSTSPWGSAPAYLEIDLPSVMTFDTVVLYPRNDAGNVGTGFPVTFSIQAPNGRFWTTRLTVTGYPAPTDGQSRSFNLGRAVTTDRLRIYATALPYTASGYVMQFAEVEVYDFGGFSTPTLRPATQLTNWFADSAGWYPDENGSTVRTMWDAHAQQLVVCGRGYYGVSCTNGESESSYSTANGWAAASYRYGSIRYPDMNGDGAPDICARGLNGDDCSMNMFSGFGSETRWTTDFAETFGWNTASSGETMMYGDIDGDGKTDVCGRGTFTLECSLQGSLFGRHHDWSWYADRRYPTSGGEFGNYDVFAFPGSSSTWSSSPAYYDSLRLVDINHDGFADACGRSSNGTYCALSMGNRFERKRQVILNPEDMTDNFGWGDPSYGSTLTFGDLDGNSRIDLCARAAAGIVCTTGY